LYQLLCNKRPFDGKGVDEIISKVIAGLKTPLSQYRPDLPQGVIEVVEKAMAHDPKDRFQSAEEFAVALRAILRNLSRSGRVPETGRPARRSLRRSVTVAGLAVLAMAALAVALQLVGVAPFIPSVQAAALAEAKTYMDRGDFGQAEVKYAGVVGQFPNLAEAMYGLGWSKVRLGKLADANDAFEKTQAPVLRAEGMAGVAVEKEGESARPQLEQAREQGASPYVNAMLAKLDIQSGKDRDAVERLQGLTADGFNYAWQYAEALQSLGQAYYHLGEFEQAAQAFKLLEQVSLPGQEAVASAYLRSITGRLDSQKRAEASAAAKRIRERMESGQISDATTDPWTSRPLTFFVLPTEPGITKTAMGTGLVDLLPTLLGDALDSKDSMNLVDRDLINEILSEQELSGLLSSAKDQLALGKVLGARLIISCRFGKLGDDEQLFVKVDDTETTERVPVKPIRIDLGANPEVVVEEAANRIWTAASQAYPVQGRLYRQDGTVLVNLGSALGVTEGMEFEVYRHPDAPPLEGVKAIVDSGLGGTTCKVRLEGVDASELPETTTEGWYVRGRQQT
jgi:tetratricopeptide (TPR) repeat protein